MHIYTYPFKDTFAHKINLIFVILKYFNKSHRVRYTNNFNYSIQSVSRMYITH